MMDLDALKLDPAARIIQPQPGPQYQFCASPADIAIYGGAGGSGKTYALELDPCRYLTEVPGFGGVIFRRTYPEITMEGALWDTSWNIYPIQKAKATENDLTWTFPPYGNTISFRHIEHEKSVHLYQGSQICYIGFDELTSFCLTPEHEVLTHRGWVQISKVQITDKVYAKMPDGSAQFRQVKSVESFDYHGKLISVYQRSGVSFIATPNHRVLIKRQDENNSLGFVEARALLNTIQMIPRCGTIDRPDRGGSVEFGAPIGRGHGTNSNNARAVALDDYLEFLGWYLSEGCAYIPTNTSSPTIAIAQKRPNLILSALMERLPWRVSRDSDEGYHIFSRQLYNHLKPLGNVYQKRVPRWIFETCSAREIEIFLQAFIDGDGHRQKGAVQIGLANEGLADDIQELCCLIGWVATRGDGVTYGTGCVRPNPGGFPVYRVSISKQSRSVTQVSPEKVQEIEYNGPVFCLTVDCPEFPDFTRGGGKRAPISGGNFMIRHNGRVCFTGNSEYQFFYLLSRNRSACGVNPYIRGTCNPDPDSWVKEFIAWWLDPQGEYPDYSKSGVLRWFIRDKDALVWGDTREELIRDWGAHYDPKSVTFIPAKLSDNPILEKADPGYRGRLMALPYVEQQQLLHGNWAVRLQAGMLFRTEWFDLVETVPTGLRMVRAYDKAATEVSQSNKDPDWTSGLLYGTDGRYFYVLDLEHYRKRPGGVEERIQYTARQLDGPGVDIVIEQEPGSAGVDDIEHYVRDVLYGFNVTGERPTGDKVTRAGIVSAAAQQKLIKILRAPWNMTFLRELVAFPTKGVHDDIVDSLSIAHLYLTRNAYGGQQAQSPIPQAHKRVPVSRTGVPAMYTEYAPNADKMPRL